MNIIVKARHMHLTKSLKEYAEEKLGKAMMRIFDRPAVQVEIELNDIGHIKNRVNKECRITVTMPRGKTVVICEVDDDMYKAIDLAHDRLLQQVKRARDRWRTLHRARKFGQQQRARTARAVLTMGPQQVQQRYAETHGVAAR